MTTTHNPKVAVIVPIYNVEKYLRECLDSIITQSYQNLEIVLVDDGSTDSSAQIAQEYFNKDSRISLLHKSNGGLSSARNVGIEYVCGNFEYQNLETPSVQRQSFISKAILKTSAPSSHHFYFEQDLTGGGA